MSRKRQKTEKPPKEEVWSIYEFEASWESQNQRCSCVLWASGTSEQNATERLFLSPKTKEWGEKTQELFRKHIKLMKTTPLDQFADIMTL